MKSRPLVPVPCGLVSAAADGSPDPFLAAIIARYVAAEQAAAARDAAIRAGSFPPPPPAERWNVSDRH